MYDIKFEYKSEEFVNLEADDEEQAAQFSKEWYVDQIEEPGITYDFNIIEIKEV
jgi:hypothetical protein